MSKPHASPDAEETNASGLPQVIQQLGYYPPNTLISEQGLARLFHRHVSSVRRAVQRDDLPPPIRIFTEDYWTVQSLTQHFAERLDTAKQKAAKLRARVAQLGVGGRS